MEKKYTLLLAAVFGALFLVTLSLYRQNQTASLDVKKAMVIVEPRKHKDFERVLTMFDAKMPVDWDMYIFHGKTAKDFLEEITMKLPSGRIIYLKSLSSDNLTTSEYNRLLKQASFWNDIDAEDILIFQTDCALCSGTPFSIDRFRKYGYLGCSYKKDSIGMNKQVWSKELPFYGIGGLSFRKKSFMLKCIRKEPNVHPDRAEDVFFSECVHAERSSLKPESPQVLCDFCSQHFFNSKSFGAHKTKLMVDEDKEDFYSYCPEARFLSDQ